MSQLPLVVPLLAPLAMMLVGLVALRQPGREPRAVLAVSKLAGPLALAASCATAVLVWRDGAQTVSLGALSSLGFALRLDSLSAAMLVLVAAMGGVVVRFSRNYLDGDARHGRFIGRLAWTVACVMMLVLSGHLVHLVVFWALSSFALHGLLVFYRQRRGAVVAARKKWIVARIGDVCLGLAALLVWRAFGTGDLAVIAEQARDIAAGGGVTLPSGAGVSMLLLPALLIAVSAALKSAMFPTHGWLIEVMETPTPVSALLHAGIINGGTFLVARLGDLMLLAPGALHVLVVVGAFTAVFASSALVTQSSVKVALAYSSAAHMGFMLMLCGLGAYPVAILHLIAHSFYKAHAFLSSGSAVEASSGARAGEVKVPSTATILTGMALSIATLSLLSWVVGISVTERPVTIGLAAILVVSLTQLWTRGLADEPAPSVLVRTCLAACGVTLAFFTLEALAARLLADSVTMAEPVSSVTLGLLALVVTVFAATVFVQLRLPALSRTPRWAALHVHLRNGFYANTWFDRFVGAFRIATPAPSALESKV